MGKQGFPTSVQVRVPAWARPNVSGAQLLFDGDGRIVVNTYLRSDDGSYYQGTIWLCNDDGTVARVLYNPGSERHGQNLVAIHPYTGEAYVLGSNQANPGFYWMDKVPNFKPVVLAAPATPTPTPSDAQQQIDALAAQVSILVGRVLTLESQVKALTNRVAAVELDPQLNEHHDWSQAKGATLQYLQEKQLPVDVHSWWQKAKDAAFAVLKENGLVG